MSEYGSFCDVQIYSEVRVQLYMGPHSRVVCVVVALSQQINSNIPIPLCSPEASTQRRERPERASGEENVIEGTK